MPESRQIQGLRAAGMAPSERSEDFWDSLTGGGVQGSVSRFEGMDRIPMEDMRTANPPVSAAPSAPSAPSAPARSSAAKLYDARNTPEIEAAIQKASARYGISPHMIRSMIAHESGFDPNIVSKDRMGNPIAYGLMQMTPGTAEEMGVTDSFNIEQNILGGTRYIAHQLQIFPTPELALSGYNAGPTKTRRYGGAIPP